MEPTLKMLRNAVGAVLDGLLDVADWCARHFGNLKHTGLSDHARHPLDRELD